MQADTHYASCHQVLCDSKQYQHKGMLVKLVKCFQPSFGGNRKTRNEENQKPGDKVARLPRGHDEA
jgi:hypothetical protein